ncbi:hypothetical protein K505DRAFT_88181 [Melanomma pulvis-pyrius CBS 109.77]|uniref:Uncharacterized protein n=1 Tax=Melanomma pulvis-pyrius CBS 109.77 TaxID=1314802 RepID=A0A6A6X108_9PLEO|nr:hypothetical protein K505DRAFT_88181 [Melanomma pulvis-pyrius CBS 109.77]
MPLPRSVISAWLGDLAAAAEHEDIHRASPSALQHQFPRAQEPQMWPLKRRALQECGDVSITTSAVAAEQGLAAQKRPRLQAQPPPQSSKRHALHETTANMPHPPDSPDPSKTSEQDNQQLSGRLGRTADSQKSSARLRHPQNRDGEIRPRRRPQNARTTGPAAVSSVFTSIEATGNFVSSPSTSHYSQSRYGELLALTEYVVSEPASNATSTSSRKSKSRSWNPSPVKSLDDMHIFDKPVFVGFVNGERPIPEVLRPYWNALEEICANIGIIPHSIKVCYLQGNAILIL